MQSPTHVTHLNLLRKYGGKLLDATTEELRAARASIPKGMNALGAAFAAMRQYSRERQ